eukprot:7390206-Prymnesium_polylepis.1
MCDCRVAYFVFPTLGRWPPPTTPLASTAAVLDPHCKTPESTDCKYGAVPQPHKLSFVASWQKSGRSAGRQRPRRGGSVHGWGDWCRRGLCAPYNWSDNSDGLATVHAVPGE